MPSQVLFKRVPSQALKDNPKSPQVPLRISWQMPSASACAEAKSWPWKSELRIRCTNQNKKHHELLFNVFLFHAPNTAGRVCSKKRVAVHCVARTVHRVAFVSHLHRARFAHRRSKFFPSASGVILPVVERYVSLRWCFIGSPQEHIMTYRKITLLSGHIVVQLCPVDLLDQSFLNLPKIKQPH